MNYSFQIPDQFFKKALEKPPYYLELWCKWLANGDAVFKNYQVVYHLSSDTGFQPETIKEVFEFGINILTDKCVIKKKGKIENEEITKAHLEMAQKILEYLNSAANTTYTIKNKATLTCILGRIQEGYSYLDFKKVIEKKAAQWLGTDQEQYLRPITLFNQSKFETYLNQPDARAKSSASGKANDRQSNVASAVLQAKQHDWKVGENSGGK